MNSDFPEEIDRESRFSNPLFWSEQWRSKLGDYRAAPPRLAAWLISHFGTSGSTFLECGAGSCCDSIDLAIRGYDAIACDFDEDTIANVGREGIPGLTVAVEDAFQLSFPEDAFDVVFHNGLWVCFTDDARVQALLCEQLRVTRHTAIAVVHNAANKSLVADFLRRGVRDKLYDIRFFTRQEVLKIAGEVVGVGHKLTIAKFGGPADRLYSIALRVPCFMPAARWLVPRLYCFQPWSRVERIILTVSKT
jgi:ubiquinone/menaquinone biosynthesis C-methylase UbiE